jgi:hypothetical protein
MKLEIVYYKSSGGLVPVKDYLSKYRPLAQDKESIQQKKIKSFRRIDFVISRATENNGIIGGEYSCSVPAHSFQKIRIKDGGNLVRILYFCYLGERLVLLNAYDKPDLYDKGAKKKIDKMINEKMSDAQNYYQDFIKNPQNYEKYQ